MLPTPSLYPQLLGPDWAGLPAVVRRLHEAGSATGHFTIRRGRGVLAALAAWIGRFPPEGEDVPTRLVVRQDGPVQHWERAFGGHALNSLQRARPDGGMGEQLGLAECGFRLRPVKEGILYEPLGAWLLLGPWRPRLPRLLAPRIEASATEAPGGMRVRVSIATPLTGMLLSYEGLIRPDAEEAAA